MAPRSILSCSCALYVGVQVHMHHLVAIAKLGLKIDIVQT
jgi:hypothetical protein